MSEALTKQIRVRVTPEFIENRSDPKRHYYFFAYHVGIANLGETTIQILGRHWIITDSTGRSEHVRGIGVVGEQPIIRPGEEFQYTSFCPLQTPFGTMQGNYHVVDDRGEQFDLQIPSFTLAHPFAVQ